MAVTAHAGEALPSAHCVVRWLSAETTKRLHVAGAEAEHGSEPRRTMKKPDVRVTRAPSSSVSAHPCAARTPTAIIGNVLRRITKPPWLVAACSTCGRAMPREVSMFLRKISTVEL